jgi:hypothetical protein
MRPNSDVAQPGDPLRSPAVSCTSCHQGLEDTQVLYTESGNPICESCLMKLQARVSLAKSADATRGLALGNPLLGLGSLFFDPFFICSLGAIGNGFYCLRRTKSDALRGEGPRNTRMPRIAAVVGMTLGALSLLLRLLR